MPMDLSIIIPVLNEGQGINATLNRILDHNVDAGTEIIVVDGDQAGSTIKYVDNDSVVCSISVPGRGCQMNHGAGLASGRTLLFLHCDTILPDDGIEEIKGLMKGPDIQAGAFDLAIDGQGFVFRMIEKISSLRSRLTRIPYGDQAIFVDHNFFLEIGAYDEVPIMEDVALMRKIKKRGAQIGFLKSSVTTSARRWKKEGVFFCTLRNWMILTLYYLGVSPERLVRYYKTNS